MTTPAKKLEDVLNWAYQIMDEQNKEWPRPDQQPPVHLWFRGNNTAGLDLIPAVFRDKENKIYEECGLLNHIAGACSSELKNHSSLFDRLSLLRHYSLPCRLLDWSTNVLVALYMAVEKGNDSKNNAEIFALNAKKLAEDIEFEHHCKEKGEFPVFIPESFHVILRSHMAVTFYLDELFGLSTVKNAALNIGLSEKFYDCIFKIVSSLKNQDIECLEQGNTPVWDNAQKLTVSDKKCSKLYKLMPTLMKTRFLEYLHSLNAELRNELDLENPSHLGKFWIYKFLFNLRKPVAVFPERKNPRLIAQSGMFTLGGGSVLPKKVKRPGIECRIPKPIHIDRNNDQLVRSIEIDLNCKTDIRKQLSIIGIHSGLVYPELQSQIEYLKNFWCVEKE